MTVPSQLMKPMLLTITCDKVKYIPEIIQREPFQGHLGQELIMQMVLRPLKIAYIELEFV